MKYSRQRELICRTVLQHPCHPTADMVYSMVREQEPTISLGTVYRNLNLLAEQGALKKISLPNASDRFDGRTDAHQHLLCKGCGKLFDVDIGPLETLEDQLYRVRDFTVTGYEVYLTGLCRDCSKT